jgi:hypothetical protein
MISEVLTRSVCIKKFTGRTNRCRMNRLLIFVNVGYLLRISKSAKRKYVISMLIRAKLSASSDPKKDSTYSMQFAASNKSS